jgi:hypothetical protein
LALLRDGAAIPDEEITGPKEMRALQELLGQKTHSRDLTVQAHGSNGEKTLLRLPAGRFAVLVVANDWQPGDPAPRPRTITIELRPGTTTALTLEDKLRKLSAERQEPPDKRDGEERPAPAPRKRPAIPDRRAPRGAGPGWQRECRSGNAGGGGAR